MAFVPNLSKSNSLSKQTSSSSSKWSSPDFSVSNISYNDKRGQKMGIGQVMDTIQTAAAIAQDPMVQGAAKVAGDAIKTVLKQPTSSASGSRGYLSSAPNPAETQLNTGIPLTLLEKNYTKVEENVCSPLHLNSVIFTLPTGVSSIINTWYTLVNTRDYQTRVQESVNWAVDINNKFSVANITTAMNSLFKSLQIYFFYRSIDSYVGYPPNQNDAMYALRSEWDFDTQYKLAEIARLLARTPMPPNMLEFSRFITANYLSGETPNSPLIKIVPCARQGVATYHSNSNLDIVINDLSNTTYIDVWNTLARCVKTWVPGFTANIYDPPLYPEYNKDFITIFNNLPCYNGISGKVVSPNVTGINQTFTYLSWTNNLDGCAVALCDAWNTTNSSMCNGLITLLPSGNSTRVSYYIVAGVKGWYPSNAYPFLRNSRLDTYITDGVTESVSHRFGADMVINVSPLMISTTAINFVDWILSSTAIKGTNVQSNFKPNPRSNRSNRSKSSNKRAPRPKFIGKDENGKPGIKPGWND